MDELTASQARLPDHRPWPMVLVTAFFGILVLSLMMGGQYRVGNWFDEFDLELPGLTMAMLTYPALFPAMWIGIVAGLIGVQLGLRPSAMRLTVIGLLFCAAGGLLALFLVGVALPLFQLMEALS